MQPKRARGDLNTLRAAMDVARLGAERLMGQHGCADSAQAISRWGINWGRGGRGVIRFMGRD